MNPAVPVRAFASAAMTVAMLAVSAGVSAQYAVSQLPPLATGGPPTNLVMMVDDSGSMAWAYVPDSMGSCAGSRAYLSSTYNALAYNPGQVYPAPSIVTSTGTVQLSSSFTAAPVDGFNPSTGTVNLQTAYQPTLSWTPGSATQSFAPHPPPDLKLIGALAPGGSTGGGGGGGTCSLINSAASQPAATTGTGNSGNGLGNGGSGSVAGYFYTYTPTNTAGTAPCTGVTYDDNCYVYTAVTSTTAPIVNGVQVDGLQNFANWYSFYRTRHLMIASAAAISMLDPALSQARVSWRALNTCQDMTAGTTCANGAGTTVDNRLRTYSGQQVINFYTWLSNVPVGNSTPMRSTWHYIGDYFSAPTGASGTAAGYTNTALGSTGLGANGPYGINPNPLSGTAPTGELACVQNYSITLTDGQWNGDSSTAGAYFGTADATATTFPDGVAYTPRVAPNATTGVATDIYGNDPNSDTLSDLAFHYWSTNLRPDLANSSTAVTPYYVAGTASPPTTADYWNPQNDPATWPHLVQMTIGIGMTSTMTATGLPWWGNNYGLQYTQAGYTNLWNGTYAWPSINNGAAQGDVGKAYDLWHAGINSRGVAFSAESPGDLFNALRTSLSRVKATLAAQSAAAVSSVTLSSSTNIYLASFTSTDWHGTLREYSFAGGTVAATPVWSTDAGGANAPVFAAASARAVATSSTGVPGPNNGITMASLATNTAWTSLFATSSAATNTLNWVLGDQTLETAAGGMRPRKVSVLGDIVDSAPVFSFQENFGYSALPEGMGATPNYVSYLAGKGKSAGSIYGAKGMVYVGANDGMMHGFDANSGKEVFAYVPHDIIPSLPALSSTAYAHQFYVDQTAYVGDACIGTPPNSCTWKSILVGTTGAGGQGVFALDVSSPAGMETASGAASKVLWDLDGYSATDTTGDPDLGFPIGRPVIARLNNGDWSAIFGNGYLSSNGCAVLFVVRLRDGQVTKIGTTGSAGSTVCTTGNLNASNGLGPVTLSDPDGNYTTDYVYAGDLLGNVWKFDLTAASSTGWSTAFGTTPLFTASAGGGSCVTQYPAAMTTCQSITSPVVLGPALPGMTGTMVYFGTGRLFAVGDSANTSSQSFYGILDSGAAISGGQGALQQETITTAGNYRTISATTVAAPKKGWYMNLPSAGERVTVKPLLDAGNVWFATVIPSGDSCRGGGTSWLMAVSATTGNVGGTNAFTSGTTSFDGQQSSSGVIEGITMVSDPPNSRDILLPCGTGGCAPISTPNKYAKGRISWHEITK